MHIDYAAGVVLHREKFAKDYDYAAVSALCAEPEVLKIAEAIGIDKINSIAATVRASLGHRYKHVTDKQRHALTVALLEAHGTARAVLALAFGVTEAEMFPDDAA